MSRAIVHLDADAFFAAVEQAGDPKLRGKPIAVGGERRGIIASASFEARKFGVYTPMPTVRARKLCPKLIVLPGDFERYEQFSNWMFGYAYDFTPDVEQTSIDEGYFDLTCTRKPPTEIALKVRDAITQRLKITVSEGIGSNKLISAIASKITKPRGFKEIQPGSEQEFLFPLPNNWLPGIGPKTSARLNSAGLAVIQQIAGTPLEMLELLLGSQAFQIRQYAHGIDDRLLIPSREPQKTFSHQETFGADLTDEEYAEATLRRMADDLFAKVRAEQRTIRTLTVKVRYNDMAEDQCSESLYEPTDLETDVYGKLRELLRRAWKRRVSLRLVSLKLSNIYDGRFRTELPLEASARHRLASAKLASVVDFLRQQHGHGVILRGHDFRLRNDPKELLSEPTERRARIPRRASSKPEPYVPLRCHSYYSFLDSTLSPTDIVVLAKQHGLPAVALTDTGNLHGLVQFVQAAQEHGIKPIIAAEVRVGDQPLLLYASNHHGYENLCRLLSRQAEQAEDEASVAGKQRSSIHRSLIAEHSDGLLAVSCDQSLQIIFGNRFYRAAYEGEGTVACPPVHYGRSEDRRRYDILQSIRTLSLLEHSHPEKRHGKPFHFRLPAELNSLCARHPEWLRATREIAERCDFSLPFGKLQFPAFNVPGGGTSHEFLRELVLQGLQRRYRGKRIRSDAGVEVSYERVLAQVREELEIICQVGYEDYFLITWDLLQTCRTRGIEWITRGSAADSLVCYCLEISNVCPIRFGLYFRRFLNKERMALHKLPDIDIDFAHDRKDDVVKILFDKYGPEHCAVVGGFSTFQARSAFADVAKVLGLSEHQVRRFTEHFPWSFGGSWGPNGFEVPKLIESLRSRPECRELPLDEEPYKTAVETAAFLDGFPRHPKMHPCGVVLSRVPMHSLTPTFIANKGYPTTHLDMDAVEAIGLVKMDILAQGGLAAMRDAKDSLARTNVQVDLDALEPWQDEAVWEMIASGGGRAVHHIESPAMTSLCQMTNVREIDGLIAIVSVIRPGAANEDKKVRFTRRYQKMEPPTFLDASLEECLRSTFGLVVYEEHILQICEAFAGLDPGRADVLRRALVKQNWKVVEEIAHEFDAAARHRGHSDEKIKEVWELVTGFNGYAFCKAHSTAYGVEAYQAAWLKKYYPAEFMGGVLSNGKGFYHPLVYVLECHQLGIKLLPPSVNDPGPRFTVHGDAIRVPLTNLKGLTNETARKLIAAFRQKAFVSITDFFSRVAPAAEELEAMIRVGAFDQFGETRTRQFWQAQHLLRTFGSLQSKQGWLVPPPGLEHLPSVPLNEPTRREHLEAETDLFGFAVSGHPLELFENVAWDSYCPMNRLHQFVGQTVTTCGLIIEQRTHHQVTGEPMKFLSLADWTGIVQTELFAPTYRNYGLATVRYPVLEIEARVEPYENSRGFSLRVIRAGKPRKRL
jgi:DNA polymerase-3 subunit alpha